MASHDSDRSGPDDVTVRGLRFDPGISVGHIVAALVPVLFQVLLATWFLSGRSTVLDNTQDQMRTLRADITAQVLSLKTEVTQQLSAMSVLQNNQFQAIRSDIANVPDLRATLLQVGQRLDRAESRADALSGKMDDLSARTAQNAADIHGTLQQLNAGQRLK